MFARLLATLVCVLNSGLCFGQAEPVDPPEHQVMVYLANESGQPPQILDRMKREIDTLMAPAGYNVFWRMGDGPSASVAGATVVILELRGVCRPPSTIAPLTPVVNGASLASSAVEDGHILPFSWLECGTLSNFLGAYLPAQTAQADQVYGQAMGRLAAHELFHILTKTATHEKIGVAKESFSAADLLSTRFSFDLTALAKFRDASPAGTGGAALTEEDDDNASLGR